MTAGKQTNHSTIRIDSDTKGRLVVLDGTPIDSKKFQVAVYHEPFFRRLNPSPHPKPDGEWEGHVFDNSIASEIGAWCFADILPTFGRLSLPFRPGWSKFIRRAFVVGRGKDADAALSFYMEIWPEDWANPYTVGEFQSAVTEIIEETGEFEIDNHGWDLKGSLDETLDPDYDEEQGGTVWPFAFTTKVESPDKMIYEEILKASERLRTIFAAAERRILMVRKDSLVTFFDFPEPFRSTCEQYLVYFIQFLEDLGIRADSEIKSHAGSVMFSVTPRDGHSALVEIRNALDLYLGLPMNAEFVQAAAGLSDVAVAQLRANVFFLQSQLELARAVIQAKEAAIQSLDFTIFQQRQLLTASLVTRSAAPRSEDEEPLLGDAVSVTKYQGKGFKVDLPLILRRLKRAFQPDHRSD